MDRKYAVLLINEGNLLRDVASENGLFTEIKNIKDNVYDIVNARCRSVLSILYAIKISKKMNVDYLNYEIVTLSQEIEKKEKEYEKFLVKAAKNEGISVDFLRLLITMGIASEYGTDTEKKIAKSIDNKNCEECVKVLKEKYIGIINSKNELNRKIDERVKCNRDIKKASFYLDLYKGTLGFSKAFIRNGRDNSVVRRMDIWHEEFQNAYNKGASIDELLEIVSTIDITEQDISSKAFKVVREKRDVDYEIDALKQKVNDIIDLCIEQIEKGFAENYKEEINELILTLKSLERFFIQENDELVTLAVNYLKKEKSDKFKESYTEFLMTMKSIISELYILKDGSETVIDLERIRDAFNKIDFKALDTVIHELRLYIKKKEIDDKQLEVGDRDFAYRDGKAAFERVVQEVFNELYLYVGNMNTVLADAFKSGEKIRRVIEEEKEKQGIDNINRFFTFKSLEKFSVMTYNYSGSSLGKYKTAAIIFDTEDMDKINLNSQKGAWNGKADRSKVAGKGQFMQGRYLFTDNGKKVLSCEILGIKEYGNDGIKGVKEQADCIKRIGALFDYRKISMSVYDVPQKFDKKQHGTISYIDSETESELVQVYGKENKENAGFLYVETVDDLAKLIMSL